MRTLDLLQSFMGSELDELAVIVSGSKRTALVKLFKELREATHKDQEPENARLFKKIYGKTYVKEKDYLLRNELRLLNEILYKFLADKTALKHIEENKSLFYYWLARGYFDRKIRGLFRTDIDEFLHYVSSHQQSLETISLPESPAMYSMKSLWMIDNQPKLPENIRQQIEVLQQWKNEEKKRFLYRIREMEAREAYLESALKNMIQDKSDSVDDRRTPGESLIDLSGFAKQDVLAEYALLKKHAYQTAGPKRIEVLKQTLALVSTDKGKEVLTLKARFGTLNQLAMDLILSGQYEQGNKYLEENIAESKEQKWPVTFSMIHNYMVNQINLGEYEKGIAIYQEYKNLIESNRLKNPGRIFLAYFHLYLGRDDEAIKLLPKETELPPNLQIICRFVYGISFLIRQEYALAVSEIKNMKRTVKAIKNGDYSMQLLIINLYLRYAQAHTKRKEDRNNMLLELKTELDANYPQWTTLAAVDVQFYWLINKMKQMD